MSVSKLDKAQWHSYFDSVSKNLEGKRAEIEVQALPVGVQIEAEWLPLLGITYDQKDDIIAVMVEGVDHMIRHASEVYVDQDAAELNSVEVNDADGVHHLIRLRDPLMLRAP